MPKPELNKAARELTRAIKVCQGPKKPQPPLMVRKEMARRAKEANRR